jgi:hypothetical protein
MIQAGKKKEITDELINGIYISRPYKKSDGMGVGERIKKINLIAGGRERDRERERERERKERKKRH